MKNSKSIYRLFLLFPLVAFLAQCDKPHDFSNQKIHRIALTCDTIPTSNNFDKVCNFGQQAGNNEDFTLKASVGDVVIWDGYLSNPKEGKIKIDNIIYESGKDVFKNKNIRDRVDGRGDGQIVAYVKQGKVKDSLKYKLRFTVYDSQSNPVVTDTIDPKIKIVKYQIQDALGEGDE